MSVALALMASGARDLDAQRPTSAGRDSAATRDSATTIAGVRVTAERDTRAAITRLTLPVTASITAQRVRETVNLVDTPDAVKYLPSVFIRKRNNGDTQAVMATRTWGVSSSARSLIYADGVPLTALIANNNTIGGPRWGLVAPEEIARIDMMYGPFSAAYAGNSMGAVMEITTRMPERFEGSVTQGQAWQAFSLYGTDRTFGTTQTSARFGNRFGKLSFVVSGNYQDSHSQPLTYVTSATFPANTTGGVAGLNKLNAAANILGASGLLHSQMTNAKAKVAYDLTPNVRAAYTYGWWENDANAGVDSYLQRSGDATFAGQSGFASGNYNLLQRHSSQSLSVRRDTRRDWDFEVVGTRYDFGTDRQRFPTSASATGTTFGAAGRVAVLSGTGWETLDLKGTWHRGGLSAAHTVSFGAHHDRYELVNPTYTTADWTSGEPYTGVATRGDGKTRTSALWAQDAWQLAPALRLTVGGRWETWRGYDGVNVNGATTVRQPEVEATKFSPKALLAWNGARDWKVTASLGKAYRFATAAELYQLVTTGATFTSPDPNLKPDNVLASELRVERQLARGRVQLALFNDDVHDAIISQFKPLVAGSSTLYSYVSNVDHVRSRGAELVLNGRDLVVRGLELSGSVTYLNARTLATSGRASATAPASAAIGKHLPNIPDWRANFVATYRPGERVGVTLAGRYSGPLWTTLDNADVNPNTYQGFSGWFVADAVANVRLMHNVHATLGVDNLLNRKYFLFHPFPQRTLSTSVRYAF
ncbi:MAG: TonB-dependent receptor [Gemmatimonadaceae bacterium]|nr:TonB-dependent receptor [Gemmatimonadaceae bacterium]